MLVILFPFLHVCIRSRSGSDEVLVVEIAVEGTLYGVGTGLGDGIDCTTCKTGLTHIERSHNHLDFLDCIQRNRICTGLASICTGRSKTEGVVGHGTVNLETVVAVVGTGEGDTAVLVERCLWCVFHDIIYASVNGRDTLNCIELEVCACTRLGSIERTFCRDDNFLKFGGRLQNSINGERITETKSHIGVLHRTHSQKRYFNSVRTTGTHTVDVEASLSIGNCSVLRA